jgi:hypothetical protein
MHASRRRAKSRYKFLSKKEERALVNFEWVAGEPTTRVETRRPSESGCLGERRSHVVPTRRTCLECLYDPHKYLLPS